MLRISPAKIFLFCVLSRRNLLRRTWRLLAVPTMSSHVIESTAMTFSLGLCGTWVIKRDLLLKSLSCPAAAAGCSPLLLNLNPPARPVAPTPRNLRRTTFESEERLCWFKAIIRGCKRFYMKKEAKAQDRRAYNYRFALSRNPLKPSLTIAACQSRRSLPLTRKWFCKGASIARCKVIVN